MSASFDIDIECIQSVAEQQANKFPVGSFFSWLPAAVSSSIVAAEGDVQLGVAALLTSASSWFKLPPTSNRKMALILFLFTTAFCSPTSKRHS